MKSFLTSLKRQSGFTLVELMVVVAIIGLLSAVAVPNFKKYQAKAKVAEAKLQLSAAYTAEQAFFSDYGIYATCLSYMGYNPSAEVSSRYFAVGFVDDNTSIDATVWAQAVNSGLADTAGGCLKAAPAANGMHFFNAGKGIGTAIVATAPTFAATLTGAPCESAIGDQSTSGDQTFAIAATGIIEGTKVLAADTACLTMTETKTILQARPGY